MMIAAWPTMISMTVLLHKVQRYAVERGVGRGFEFVRRRRVGGGGAGSAEGVAEGMPTGGGARGHPSGGCQDVMLSPGPIELGILGYFWRSFQLNVFAGGACAAPRDRKAVVSRRLAPFQISAATPCTSFINRWVGLSETFCHLHASGARDVLHVTPHGRGARWAGLLRETVAFPAWARWGYVGLGLDGAST